MTSPWIVSTNTDRVTLDAARHAELTFTVTNSSDASDQVVFEAVPGEGVDRTALRVENPTRRVAGGASAAFLLDITLGPQAASGHYEVYGQAYSAHLAPEETLGRSGRVVFDFAPAPQKKPFPWWIVAVAGLVVVVIVVVLVVALHGHGSTPPPAAKPATVAVPNLAGTAQTDAVAALRAAGLRAGSVRLRSAAGQQGVAEQTPAAGAVVKPGSAVDLIVAVDLATLPQPTGKAPTGTVAGLNTVAFTWQPTPGVTHYLLVVQRQYCGTFKVADGAVARRCFYNEVLRQQVTGDTFTANLAGLPAQTTGGSPFNGNFQWQLADTDDFGTSGPLSGPIAFTAPA